ncbi:MAG: hypothetical protein K8L91_19775 [Anaerolineae bacterium]|nr:hypothetical protein [Anaerolineae bacterium]
MRRTRKKIHMWGYLRWSVGPMDYDPAYIIRFKYIAISRVWLPVWN